VDSAYLLHAAAATLGSRNVLAATGVSGSLAQRELAAARELSARLGVEHRLVETHEIDSPGYVANAPNRCYFCKGELYVRLAELARAEGYAAVVDGTNADDLTDHRPGHRAAGEHAVRSPLAELGFTKADVRALAARLGLPSADKPAMPCLSSRFPYGSRITAEQLTQVEAGETWFRERGFRDVRLRHHGSVARLELEPGEFARLVDSPLRDECVRALKRLGFAYVALDLQGFRSGSLNETLPAEPVSLTRRPIR
jgi:uncharacterized protein